MNNCDRRQRGRSCWRRMQWISIWDVLRASTCRRWSPSVGSVVMTTTPCVASSASCASGGALCGGSLAGAGAHCRRCLACVYPPLPARRLCIYRSRRVAVVTLASMLAVPPAYGGHSHHRARGSFAFESLWRHQRFSRSFDALDDE